MQHLMPLCEILNIVLQFALLFLTIWIIPRRISLNWYAWPLYAVSTLCIWLAFGIVSLFFDATYGTETASFGWLVMGLFAAGMGTVVYSERKRSQRAATPPPLPKSADGTEAESEKLNPTPLSARNKRVIALVVVGIVAPFVIAILIALLGPILFSDHPRTRPTEAALCGKYVPDAKTKAFIAAHSGVKDASIELRPDGTCSLRNILYVWQWGEDHARPLSVKSVDGEWNLRRGSNFRIWVTSQTHSILSIELEGQSSPYVLLFITLADMNRPRDWNEIEMRYVRAPAIRPPGE